VPYQNSVESEAARTCVRMICGVIDKTIFVLLPVRVVRTEQAAPRLEFGSIPEFPRRYGVSESWMRPARICVSPSFSRKQGVGIARGRWCRPSFLARLLSCW